VSASRFSRSWNGFAGTAHQVVAGSGTAVITGRDQDRVRAAIEALSQNGKACGITAELTDRD
jgi:hypothetical protein